VARYATTIDAPVILEAGVDRLRPAPGGDGFELETAQGSLVAREVVVATGGFHVTNVPSMAAGLSSRVLSLHSRDYRRDSDLPPGSVLVVGSGQTGVQLVEELQAAGRDVHLSVGSAGRAPRHYRGRDIFYWLWQMAERGEEVGVGLPTVGQLPDPGRRLAGNPQLSGHGGGHDIDLRAMGRDGVVLLGRLTAIDGERVRFAPDVHDNLAYVDRSFDERLRQPIDGFIAAARLDCPPADEHTPTPYEPPTIEEIDLARAGIGTILWTTGYRPDLSWIEPPITDEMGFARQVRGVTEVPGLYVLGSLWQHDQTSATLFGMPRDARVLAARMGLPSRVG
jgi:putative flavoprotein involved in K+ transport